jgi:hypothetical protein
MDSIIVTRRAPSGANYYDAAGANLGKVVYSSGPNEVTLQTDPATATGAMPLGILVAADDDQNGGYVSVCIAGKCHALLNAAYTVGTSAQSLMADGTNSRCIAATDGNYRVGYYADKVNGVAGQLAEIIVAPGVIETT